MVQKATKVQSATKPAGVKRRKRAVITEATRDKVKQLVLRETRRFYMQALPFDAKQAEDCPLIASLNFDYEFPVEHRRPDGFPPSKSPAVPRD
jgi:hypothetical protein